MNLNSWPYSEYVVYKKLEMLYCCIFKTATTSIKKWFADFLNLHHKTLDVHEYSRKYLSPKNFANEWQYIRDNYFKFIFVRNPLERFVSAYINKFVEKPETLHEAIRIMELIQRKKERFVDYRKGITFREFANHVLYSNEVPNLHWRQQSDFLLDFEFDYIGRFEDLPESFKPIIEASGNNKPLCEENITSRIIMNGCFADYSKENLLSLKGFPSYNNFFDDGLKRKVINFYRKDIEMFNFSSVCKL